MSVIPDSEFGARVRSRLRDEDTVWLTTTTANGTPQPNPVWFLWNADDETVLVYNANDAKRLDRFALRPRVALNFNTDESGDDVVVLTGVAEQALDVPAPDRNEAYLAKYADAIARIGLNRNSFAQKYSVPVRVRIEKARGF